MTIRTDAKSIRSRQEQRPIVSRGVVLRGVVQGVGMRPRVARLARAALLRGQVCNAPDGVHVELFGPRPAIADVLRLLRRDPHVERVAPMHLAAAAPPQRDFSIGASRLAGDRSAALSPDLVACATCIAEVRAPGNRRHQYPFTTCAECGPRYSIATGLPWDRARTAMAPFPMCQACAGEYADPTDRRYHAQTIACPACGPTLLLHTANGGAPARGDAALDAAVLHLRAGRIVAAKGLGGFQLLADARCDTAVAALRARKRRPSRPFAIMVADLAAARRVAEVDPAEAALLASAAGPIVLLRHLPESGLSGLVAPHSPLLGVLLPTTPLHQLLLDRLGAPIIATSGNRGGEPICHDDALVDEVFAGLADAILTHDRRIHHPVDDSLARVMAGAPVLLRRARGYVPQPIRVDRELPACAAVSGHLKAAPALAAGRLVYLTPHVGDLDDLAARDRLRDELRRGGMFSGVVPMRVAADGHRGYGSSHVAASLGLPVHDVQHHLAHVLACAAEHGVRPPFLGVAFDGNGRGDDGTLWGSELFVVTDGGCERRAWLAPFPLPGGEHAFRDPALAALGLLHARLPPDEASSVARELLPFSAQRLRGHLSALAARHGVLTSAAGRLFDATCALLALRREVSFDGEAAMAVEYAAAPAWNTNGVDPTAWATHATAGPIDLAPLIRALIDCRRRNAIAQGAALLHRFLIATIAAVTSAVGLRRVVLSGGCFQNHLLLEGTTQALRTRGHEVHFPQRVPANDGGLALGQAYALANPAWNPATAGWSVPHVPRDPR